MRGRPADQPDPAERVVVEYGYDDASQLTSQVYKQGGTTLGTLTYTLDVLGRRARVGGTYARTGVPQALTGASYDAANQLTSCEPTGIATSATPRLNCSASWETS